jgi:hypothetical protein
MGKGCDGSNPHSMNQLIMCGSFDKITGVAHFFACHAVGCKRTKCDGNYPIKPRKNNR